MIFIYMSKISFINELLIEVIIEYKKAIKVNKS